MVEDPEHWKRLCLAYAERVDYCRGHYDNEQYEIQYEELCREPERVTAGLFDFVGLAFTSEARSFAKENLDPSRPGSAGRGTIGWRFANLRSRFHRIRRGA